MFRDPCPAVVTNYCFSIGRVSSPEQRQNPQQAIKLIYASARKAVEILAEVAGTLRHKDVRNISVKD